MLIDHVQVARRFQRAIRIDTDLNSPEALDGFVCSPSAADILKIMAQHALENSQGAFTWTGPYGSGKSSLVVALSAMLSGDKKIRKQAEAIFGKETSRYVHKALPPRARGWHVLPVVGRRDRPEQVIGEAINAADFSLGRKTRNWKEKQVIDALKEISGLNPRASGGLIVFVDEMGKFLESAAYDGSDIYLFQQLAELASRSSRRLIIVGILHQSFDAYAHRLSLEIRDEWAKVQGRFVDLSVNVSAGEQIELLGRTIIDNRPKESAPSVRKQRPQKTKIQALAEIVAEQTRKSIARSLPEMLVKCWPLHPIVTCLLGAISRRRFGQSQRSMFGFLNSAEPKGFQDFLQNAGADDLYGPDNLWDYLRINLEMSILASPDGHRWALVVDALERCEAKSEGELHSGLLKIIGIVDMFKEASGLRASKELLTHALPGKNINSIAKALEDLESWSLIVYRKFAGAYSIFEGSDFDIEQAVKQASQSTRGIDFLKLGALAELRPIVAKRHYHKTGALRWFDVMVVALSEVRTVAANYTPIHGAVGAFLLAIPTQNETKEVASKICKLAARSSGIEKIVVVGVSQRAWGIPDLACEFLALERVRDEVPELMGDRVARSEIHARIEDLQGKLEGEVGRAFNSAQWFRKGSHSSNHITYAGLNSLASDLADKQFSATPRIHNELLSRMKPSSSATAGLNALLRRMMNNEGDYRLGIVGFPAEGGLFSSLLEATQLYRRGAKRGWHFAVPNKGEGDPGNLAPAWEKAEECLKKNKARTVSAAEIYEVWRAAPYGIKEGLLPVLFAAFFLSQRQSLAFYRGSTFQAKVSDFDMEHLTVDPENIRLRWMDLSSISRRLLSGLADVVRDLDQDNTLADLKPIDVARGLIRIYDQLPTWVWRTQQLSENAKSIRTLFKKANDPNKFIFDDIPKILTGDKSIASKKVLRDIEEQIRSGLAELRQAYPTMLGGLREQLLTELQVANASSSSLSELRSRAHNIREISGDHRLEAFAMRVASFSDSDEDMEGLASMAANKPIQNWVDADIDRAAVQLAEMAQKFVRIEAFAHVKGRSDKRHAMALVVGVSGAPATFRDEFDITDTERSEVGGLLERLAEVLEHSGESRRNVILATLAELSMRYLRPSTEISNLTRKGNPNRRA